MIELQQLSKKLKINNRFMMFVAVQGLAWGCKNKNGNISNDLHTLRCSQSLLLKRVI